MIRKLSLLGLLAAIGIGTAVAADTSGQQLAQDAGHSLIGSPAPRLVLKTIDGGSVDLARFYGRKAVYLKFWATWCVPCREQMPHFEHAYETKGDDLAVIAVNVGFNDSLEDVKAYRHIVGLKMPIVIDDGRLAEALHLRVTPQHIVIGRDGRVAYIGHLVDARLESALREARAKAVNVSTASEGPAVASASRYRVGDRVSGESIALPDGRALPASDPAGRQSTVLVFLSPWCESYLAKSRPQRAEACRRSREDSERLAATPGLRWIGIASGLWATAADLEEYRTQKHVTIPISLDQSGDLFRRFGVKDVPAFVVIDATGRVVSKSDRPPDAPLPSRAL